MSILSTHTTTIVPSCPHPTTTDGEMPPRTSVPPPKTPSEQPGTGHVTAGRLGTHCSERSPSPLNTATAVTVRECTELGVPQTPPLLLGLLLSRDIDLTDTTIPRLPSNGPPSSTRPTYASNVEQTGSPSTLPRFASQCAPSRARSTAARATRPSWTRGGTWSCCSRS